MVDMMAFWNCPKIRPPNRQMEALALSLKIFPAEVIALAHEFLDRGRDNDWLHKTSRPARFLAGLHV
jgi:hypothetical protein